MDVLAHGLWSNVMYKVIPQTRTDKKTTLWGIVFGVLPDFVSFTPIFILFFLNLLTGQAEWASGRPDFENVPLATLTSDLYNYTHSFIIFFLVVGAAWLIWKKFPWFLLGWGLHISIDIFSHSREFFPTPFLFPVSNAEVDGIPWSHPIFMRINYGLLVLMYVLVLPKLRKIKDAEVSPASKV